ncbi:MAG: S8 family serine peptidase [bacterium]
MKRNKLTWALLLTLVWPAMATVQVHLVAGDRISLSASNAPLPELLCAFAAQGVKVIADPSLQSTVTLQTTATDLEKTLNRLLQPYDYAITWRVLEGPVGQLSRLSELRVFEHGNPERVVAVNATPRSEPTVTQTVARVRIVPNEVLLRLKRGVSTDQFRTLLRGLNADVVDCLRIGGIYRLRLPPGSDVSALLEQLAGNALVDRAEPNYIVELPRSAGTPGTGNSRTIQPPPHSEGPASVAVIDSGFAATEDLTTLVTASYNAVNPGAPMTDTVGHGTQMSRLAAGTSLPENTDLATPTTAIIAIKGFDDQGLGNSFELSQAVAYAVDHGARTLNLSWEVGANSQFVGESLAYAQNHDVLVIAAAGNTPTGQAVYPAAYPGVVAVSALEANNRPWALSNYGTFVALAAPGTAILPTGNTTGSYAGTSIASAYTAHIVAVYRAANPKATAAETRSALLGALSPAVSDPNGRNYGAGVLDKAAVQRLLH